MMEKNSITAFDGKEINIYEHPGSKGQNFTVFCHGITADWSEEGFYEQIIEHFPPEHPCFFLEMRAHGESSLSHEDFSITTIVADIIRAFEFAQFRTQSQSGNLLASSFSGGASLLAAFELGKKVDKIALINPRITYRYWLDDINGWNSSSKEFSSRLASGRVKKGDWTVSPTLLNELITYNAWHCIPNISQPIITFHGNQDTLVPFSESEELAALVAAKLIPLSNVDHGIVTTDGSSKFDVRALISNEISKWFFK